VCFNSIFISCISGMLTWMIRYVGELLKLKDTFIDPLLHPFSSTSASDSPFPSPGGPELAEYAREDFPVEVIDHLPIAARFLSGTPTPSTRTGYSGRAETPATRRGNGSETPLTIPPADGESFDSDEDEDRMGTGYSKGKQKEHRSPYGTAARVKASSSKVLPFPSRSHQSLPPPPRQNPNTSTHSLGRQSYIERTQRGSSDSHDAPTVDQDRKSTATPGASSRLFKKLQKRSTPVPKDASLSIAPHLLPEDLRKCLEVLEDGILSGHMTMSDRLRKRYDEQYPLVRSLADIFVSQVCL